MSTESTRRYLLGQHERLRDHLEKCTRLATRYQVDQGNGRELERELDALREEFALHNEVETTAITRLIKDSPGTWGSAMIQRMFEEHIAEHDAFWELLSGTTTEVAARIADLAAELDAHMAAEERTFLAPGTLRDDVIRARTGGEPPR